MESSELESTKENFEFSESRTRSECGACCLPEGQSLAPGRVDYSQDHSVVRGCFKPTSKVKTSRHSCKTFRWQRLLVPLELGL